MPKVKDRGLSDVLFFQALDENLYDVIQISPKEKPVAAVNAVKNRQRKQTNSSLDEQPKRPPKGNRTHEVNTVNKL